MIAKYTIPGFLIHNFIFLRPYILRDIRDHGED